MSASFRRATFFTIPRIPASACRDRVPARIASASGKEAQNVAELTGWNVDDMRRKMHLDTASATPAEKKWWEKIW